MPSQERILTSTDGTKIWAESAGDASKPAMVFIHGLSCTALGFDHQFADAELLTDFYLVRYEMRGHGRSDKPLDAEAYESARFAQDFKTVCDAFGLNRPFLWAWSLGGTVAVDVIAAYGPESLAGVLYVGGGVLSTNHIGLCAHPTILGLLPTLISESADDVPRGAEGFVDSAVASPLPYATKLQWMGAFVAQPRTSRFHHIHRTQPHDVWQRTAKGVPVLVVNGKEDQHCLYENMIGIARTVYDSVEVELLDGVGHSPQFEEPAKTNAVVREWATRVLRNA
ncbi:alpha/beta-hydrolase [Polyporus arcularius HHB13444]|uniref:Alpha/beta-hydrolase n=1 Tax=Polyporus arcularius HHB13444 TaxID=1314778 RepID=A0A5C3PGZ1_9APHY|nr:alpha/beta-hydrolase [Polyporus arcularius HHB13444]